MIITAVTNQTIVYVALAAFIWALTHYYIRLGMNPEVTNLESHKQDTFYGAISVFVGGIIWVMLASRVN